VDWCLARFSARTVDWCLARRRRRRAWHRFSGLQLLRELDPIPVRVVYVEQSHLALELEDDADVHAGVAQPLRLRLQIFDIDVRDGAVLLRLALGEAELHLAVLQVRPALDEVDGGLLEAARVQ